MATSRPRTLSSFPFLRIPASVVMAVTLTLGLPDAGILGSLQSAALAAPADQDAADAVGRRERLISSACAALGLRHGDLASVIVPPEPGRFDQPIEISIGGDSMRLDVQPHSVRTADYILRVQLADGSYEDRVPGPVRTFRGQVAGEAGSVVAGSVLADGVHAVVRSATGERIWIQPLASIVPGAAADEHIVYTDEDVIPHAATCGVTDQRMADELPIEAPGTEGGGVAGADLFCAELACDADFQYFQDWGSVDAVEARIESVINSMNVQYETEVSIGHGITTIIVRASAAADPYTTSDPNGLLNAFREQWEVNHTDIDRDVAHLFTGRNLNGSVIGIAWLSAVCSSLGYGVVQSDFSGNFSCVTDLSAHELGHNWGADHCSCSSFTMNPSITCANQFSPSATVPDIVNFRNSRPCLEMCDQPEFGSAPFPFFDAFPSTTLDTSLWTGIDGASVNTTGSGEPSPSLALNVNGSDEIRTARLDASAAVRVNLSYWWQRTGGGNSPEAGEDLLVEYLNDQLNWVLVSSHPGNGPDGDPFQLTEVQLPDDARHETLRVRFRGISTTANSDDWFVDDVAVNAIFVPANNQCETSTLVYEGDTPFTTLGASATGPDETDDGCGQMEADVWFKFGSECAGTVTVSVCDADFDTQLAVYGSCPVFADDLIACNDDACGAQSTLSFAAELETLYRIRVGGFQAAEGNGTLTIVCDPTPACVADCGQTDGIVDIVDLLTLLAQWGGAPAGCDLAPEGAPDGVVDILDLLALLAAWGACP